MTSDDVKQEKQAGHQNAPSGTADYDPFRRGQFPVGVRTVQALDTARGRLFPCEIWYPALSEHMGQDAVPGTQDVFTVSENDPPRTQRAVRNAVAQPGTWPLIIYSHGTAHGHRRMATFLCTHLASHGYLTAAMDHSEVVAVELARVDSETNEQRAARAEARMASRVPDIRFLLDQLLNGTVQDFETRVEQTQVGIVGHSFGGWTALAATAGDLRIRAVVALAPGGSSLPKPGLLPLRLTFEWGREVPTLYLVAENDAMTPLAGMHELFARTPATKQMFILRRADHAHFMDNVEQEHEAVRTMQWTGELAWIPMAMRPVAELCSGEQAHLFVRGLTLCHMDAALRQLEGAQRVLSGDLEAELALRGIEVIKYKA